MFILSIECLFNGRELIPQSQLTVPGYVDAKNGPIPQFCNINELTNITFLLTFHIIAHYWENPRIDGNDNIIFPPNINDIGNTVLYNRWSEIADIDNANYTTYTRQGKYVIRSDNFEGKVADELRTQMAVLAPYDGFLRISSQYQVDPSGLAISYRIVDREQFKMPPFPSFEASGEYTESAFLADLSKRYGEVHVKLKGDLFTSQSILLDTAIEIATSKVANRGNQLPPDPLAPTRIGIPQNAIAKIDLYNNTVEFAMRVYYQCDPARARGTDAFNGMTTYTPFSEGVTQPPEYEPYGSASILLHAAKYYDPSLVDTELGPDGQLTDGLEPGTAGQLVEGDTD